MLAPTPSSPLKILLCSSSRHQTKATAVEQAAKKALRDSEEGLALARNLMDKENKVKELIGDLKTM